MEDRQFYMLLNALSLSHKELMTYKEAVIYTGRSTSWFKRKIKEYLVYPNIEGYYRKKDLDRIKNGVRTEVS